MVGSSSVLRESGPVPRGFDSKVRRGWGEKVGSGVETLYQPIGFSRNFLTFHPWNYKEGTKFGFNSHCRVT